MGSPTTEERPAVVWTQLLDGTLFNASILAQKATHMRLGPLVSAAEDLLPGICIISCGTERPRRGEQMPEEEHMAFRAHFLVSDGAGQCLHEDSCQRLACTLEQTLHASLAPPHIPPAPTLCINSHGDREHGTAGWKGGHEQQQHHHPLEMPRVCEATSSLPSQLKSTLESSPASIPTKALSAAAPVPSAVPYLPQQSSIQSPLQAALTGQPSMQMLLSESSNFLHGSSSSSSADVGPEMNTASASASPAQTHAQICISPNESMAASISSLTAQARGVSREDRFRAAAALWELDMSEIHFQHKLGEGSFGEVLLGSFRGTKVAIKRMHEGQLHKGGDDGQGTAAQSFEREIETLACIRHPNVVNFFGACHAPPHLCLVTEHCARGSLDQLLHKSGLQINLARAIEFAIDIARGMNCLHEQRPAIIHRDLKTANLLVSARFEIKVADLGLSCVKDQARSTSSEAWLEGTVEYSAPEVLRGEPCSEKCDVWSYGVVLHELLTRERPYSDFDCSVYLMMIKIGDGSLRLPPVPEKLATPGLVRLVSRCLSMQPGDRPSFRDILFHLEPEYKVAKGRAPAVPRSGSATSMLESCKLQQQQQLLRRGNAARTQRQQQQQGQPEQGQGRQQQQSKLPTCSAFDPLPNPEGGPCCPPAEQHTAAVETRCASNELQHLHHATVSSQVSSMPPTRAQAPTPAYNRSPSVDLVHSEPVVKMKHKESEVQEQQQQEEHRQQEQQQQKLQQEDMLMSKQQVLRDHQRAFFGLSARYNAGLPRISEESTACSSMDARRESGSSFDLPVLRPAPSSVAQPPVTGPSPLGSPLCSKQPMGDAHSPPNNAKHTCFLHSSTPQPSGPSNNASNSPAHSKPAGASSPFANNASPAGAPSPFANNASPAGTPSPFANNPSPPHSPSPCPLSVTPDPSQPDNPHVMSSPFAGASPALSSHRAAAVLRNTSPGTGN